jgi:hypothetical protein
MAGIESYHRLDVRFFHKNNYLRPGLSFSWQWTRGGEPSGNININVENDCLILCYCLTRNDKSEKIEERVSLSWTRCNYGGERPWFRCPGCGRRVAVLILGGKLFLCRHCYRLKYCSQLERDMDRANSKIQKLKDRLNRKGLHQKTRERLRQRLSEAQMQDNELLIVKLGKLLKRHP